jgi:guanylate kinase
MCGVVLASYALPIMPLSSRISAEGAAPASVMIFVKTPSLSILEQRLKKRGSETAQDSQMRLKIAIQELREEPNYDYTIINDNLSRAYQRLESIVYEEIYG